MSVDRPKPDLLTLADWERLHHTLGVIGDEARPARPYIDLRTLEVPIRTFAAPRPVGRRVFVGVAAITSLAIGVLAWRLNDSHTTVVTAIDPTDQPDSASPATSPTTDPTAAVTTPVVSTATVPAPAPSTPVSPLSLGFEGPWYNVGLDGAESAGPTIGQADLLGGESTTIWIGGNSAGPAPVVVLFRTAVGGAYRNRLRGSEEHPSGVDPDAALVSDPTDQPDPDHPQLVGNELRWKRKDGVVLQFTSFGLSPSALELAVSLIQDPPAQTCFPSCTLPTFNLVGTFGQTALDGGNGLQVVTEDIRWADSTLRLERYQGAGFENVAEWTSEEVRQIDFDQSALIVDGTVALWDRDGYRFKLSGIPEGQLDTVLGELRVTGAPMTLGEGWNRLSDPPLSPRSNAVAAWTGNELILSGGDTVDCATGGDCAPGERFVDRSSASSTECLCGSRAMRQVALSPSLLTMPRGRRASSPSPSVPRSSSVRAVPDSAAREGSTIWKPTRGRVFPRLRLIRPGTTTRSDTSTKRTRTMAGRRAGSSIGPTTCGNSSLTATVDMRLPSPRWVAIW